MCSSGPSDTASAWSSRSRRPGPAFPPPVGQQHAKMFMCATSETPQGLYVVINRPFLPSTSPDHLLNIIPTLIKVTGVWGRSNRAEQIKFANFYVTWMLHLLINSLMMDVHKAGQETCKQLDYFPDHNNQSSFSRRILTGASRIFHCKGTIRLLKELKVPSCHQRASPGQQRRWDVTQNIPISTLTFPPSSHSSPCSRGLPGLREIPP